MMTPEKNNTDTFYEHFRLDKPTKIGGWIAKAFSRKIFRYAKLCPSDIVLEIGPGRGVFADICLRKNVEYFAIEPNPQMAESLQRKGASVICAIVPPLPQLEKQFDAVVMINVLEHMNSLHDALQVTRQVKEILRPKGRLVICSPDYLNLRHNFFNCDFSHNYVTTQRRLKQLLFSAGFEPVTSSFLSGPVGGFIAFVLSALISRAPFGVLSAMFPENKLFQKLYKLQLAFSRKVLIIAEKAY